MTGEDVGLILLAAGNILGTSATDIPRQLFYSLSGKFSSRIVVDDSSPDYEYFDALLTLSVKKPKSFIYSDNVKRIAPGRHWFKHDKFWVIASKSREECNVPRNGKNYSESISFTSVFGSIDFIFDYVYGVKAAEATGLVSITSSACDWMVYKRQKRSLESVYIPLEQKADLVQTIETFIGSESWYFELGIPYRIGLLLHGEPGCGKTSIIKALASHFNLTINRIVLSDNDLTDSDLENFINKSESAKQIFVIEDVDRAFSVKSEVTMAGLLNALDGLTSPDGVILIMTTNHIDKLDPALIRAGRVDKQFHVQYARRDEIVNYFVRFYGEYARPLGYDFAGVVGDNTVPMANIQNHLREWKACPNDAIVNWKLDRAEPIVQKKRKKNKK